jgi:hypothetical protein
MGWKPKLYPVVVTHSGCVTLSLRKFFKTDCGLTDAAVDTKIKSLQAHTFIYNHKFITLGNCSRRNYAAIASQQLE